MGREIKRVPLDFNWPIHETWLAYQVGVSFPPCPDCRDRPESVCMHCMHRHTPHSTGWSKTALAIKAGLFDGSIAWPADVGKWDGSKAMKAIFIERGLTYETDAYCPRCEGRGDLSTPELRAWADTIPEVKIPEGEGWQLWQNVSDAPMSPVFATSDLLVQWMTTNPWQMGPNSLIPSTREVAEAFVKAGWAPSGMITPGHGFEDGVTAIVRMAEESA